MVNFIRFTLMDNSIADISKVNQLKPKKAYLTHIAPDMGLHNETEKMLPQSVSLGYDGLEIILND